ncbi:MAG TPA: hypothetical protein VLL25_07500, partial [Acidimicrobiales bacterium]|nr:hypothetical protein [Acidimicrobiales bacterium]
MSTSSPTLAPASADRITKLELFVLAADRDHCAGIDLASGALVRAWTTEPVDPQVGPYDIVTGTVEDGRDRLPDPTEPEAVVL